ncbi:MAG: hypothetical protein BEN18_06215 [Epulopiscium sp. Nuni2H_MBin001]|nr:MAG: hypothetical protein BEN18_06215 [Epulopiscium sp. Nuni2H_MBin001]
MELKTKLIISTTVFIIFIIYFSAVFLPAFEIATNSQGMVDAYLVDYTKSISDIEELIINYGETGRAFMLNFFIADTMYIIVSVPLFSLLILALTQTKYLPFIPVVAGIFDTIENIAVFYSASSLNMQFLGLARFFATAKGVCLVISWTIIIGGLIRSIVIRMKKA